MYPLIGAGLFLALLFPWLRGNRFAQAGMFPLFLAFAWSITDMLILDWIRPAAHIGAVQTVLSVFAFFVGGIGAWLAASAPVHYWRHHTQEPLVTPQRPAG